MKKIIAVLIALITLASGCGKAETEITESTTGIETTISWEEAEVLRAEKLVATKEDFEVLKASARMVLRCATGDNGYDCTSDTAFKDAMYMMYNSGVHLGYGINGKESDSECFGEYDEDAGKFVFEPDPLNKFADVEDAAGYVRINAEYVEWVLENVLCVTPDRTKSSDDFDYSFYPNAEEFYYYDGYYYYSRHEGGGGGPLFEIIGYNYNRDGSYTVKFTTFDRDREDEYDVENGLYYGYSIIEANASLKEVDGERVWAISYVKVVEDVDFEG